MGSLEAQLSKYDSGPNIWRCQSVPQNLLAQLWTPQGAALYSSRVHVVVAATISPGVAQLTGMGEEAVRVVEEGQAPSEAADAVADANGLRVQAADMR